MKNGVIMKNGVRVTCIVLGYYTSSSLPLLMCPYELIKSYSI